jgi:hypothetical protein
MGQKLVSQHIDVLRDVPNVLRSQSALIEKLSAEVGKYQRRREAEDVVSMLDEKGLSDQGTSWATRVQEILDSGKDLSVVKQAADLATSNFGFAKVADDSNDGSPVDAFEAFITTGE